MGSSASKAASKGASVVPPAANAARKYPTRMPPVTANPNKNTQAGKSKTVPEAAEARQVQAESEARRSDATVNTTSSPRISDFDSPPDSALNARLKNLGPVQPNPTQSNSSTFHSHSPATSSFADPTLSATQFQPSASNPLQSIFPSSSNTNTNSGAGTRSSGPGSNPAVSLLTARYRLAGEADDEFARTGKSAAAEGRQFLDVHTLRQILVLRDEKGIQGGEIERALGLKRGVVSRLGRTGVVGVGS